VAFAAFPLKALCQKENPRGIYKMTSFETKWGSQGVRFEQYKACTDSVTLTFKLYKNEQGHFFSVNRYDDVFNYTGEEPASEEDKSTLIFDSDDKHFSLKWWIDEVGFFNPEFPELPKNSWITEKYESGKYSDAGKMLFDAITLPMPPDKEIPIIGVWRNLGVLLEVNEEKIDSLKKGYPNSPLFDKSFYVFTSSYWANTNPTNGDNSMFGPFGSATYYGKDSFSDGVLPNPYPLNWITDDLVVLVAQLPNGQNMNIILERVKEDTSVFSKIASWYVPRDFNWFLRRAQAGNADMQCMLGNLYFQGQGVEQDINKGMEWVVKSAEGGSKYGQYVLGMAYLHGKGVESSEEKGYMWLRKAAEQGEPNAQNMVGGFYLVGKVVEKDYQEAVKWFELSAKGGNMRAYTQLGFFWKRNGEPQKSFSNFLSAAKMGDAEAQNEVAWMLYTGEDVPQDLPQAFEWAQKAVKQGYSYGYGTLGEMYYKGKGVAQDKTKAFELYSKGAELNDRESIRMLVIMYKGGEGTPKDKKKAAYWKKIYEEKLGKKKK